MRLFIVIFLITTGSYAKNFGVVGDVYPIKEESLITLIKTKAATLSSDDIQKQIKKKIASHIDRPKALDLPKGVNKETHLFNPVFVLNTNIYDARGQILYPKGISINPLMKMPAYNPVWLFLNADDKAQVLWAIHETRIHSNAKIILTGGSIFEAERRLKKTIYFDQAGRLTKKLHIHQNPARVTRQGNSLLIESLHISETGDEV